MKKIFTLTLAIIMAISLVACGDNATTPSNIEPPSDESTTSQTNDTDVNEPEDASPTPTDTLVGDATFSQGVYKGIDDDDSETETIDGLRLEEGTFTFWIRGAAYTFEGKADSDFYTKNAISGERVICSDGNTYYASMRLNDDGTILLSILEFVDSNGPCPLSSTMQRDSSN